jgi:hypothetical protein
VEADIAASNTARKIGRSFSEFIHTRSLEMGLFRIFGPPGR